MSKAKIEVAAGIQDLNHAEEFTKNILDNK